MSFAAAVGDFLPVAFAVSLSPFPVVAAIAVVGNGEKRAPGISFAIGWVLGLAVLAGPLATAAVEALRAGLSPGGWVQILVGTGLLYAALRKWRNRPREEAVTEPGWMKRLDGKNAGQCLGIGLALAAISPKRIALTAAAVGAIASHDLSPSGIWLATLVFVGIGASSVVAVVLMPILGGAAALNALDGVKRFMLRNNNGILMGIFVLIGLKVIGDGIGTLAG